MVSSNVRPSSVIIIKGTVPPQSLTAAAASLAAWVDVAAEAKHAIAVLHGSIAAGATMTITAQQSQTSDGASPKALNVKGAASVAYNDTKDNTYEILDLDEVDVENGYRYINITATATGAGDAALVSLALLGVGPRHELGLSPSTT